MSCGRGPITRGGLRRMIPTAVYHAALDCCEALPSGRERGRDGARLGGMPKTRIEQNGDHLIRCFGLSRSPPVNVTTFIPNCPYAYAS